MNNLLKHLSGVAGVVCCIVAFLLTVGTICTTENWRWWSWVLSLLIAFTLGVVGVSAMQNAWPK